LVLAGEHQSFTITPIWQAGWVDGRLLDEDTLEASSVVANRSMNRERQLAGVNSYARELGFDPLDWVKARRADGAGVVRWLDLCCGTGRALLQAGDRLGRDGLSDRVSLVGVDLVDCFDETPVSGSVRLVCASAVAWAPPHPFDLITCVHGLHYIGDKLALLARVAMWLAGGGLFVAHLDLANIRLADGRPAGGPLGVALRRAGFSYDSRRRRLRRIGPGEVDLPYEYLGADDRAGPNYTRQPAVNSHYTRRR
jgi:SAM-dependent methyltransferase